MISGGMESVQGTMKLCQTPGYSWRADWAMYPIDIGKVSAEAGKMLCKRKLVGGEHMNAEGFRMRKMIMAL